MAVLSRKCRVSPPRDPKEDEDRETAEDEYETKSNVLVHSKRTSQQQRQRADSVNHVQADPRVQQLLKEYPRVTQVSSSGYSKLLLQHGIYHHIDTGEVRASHSRMQPLFGKKRRSGTRVQGDVEGGSSQPQRRESMGRPAAHGQEAGDRLLAPLRRLQEFKSQDNNRFICHS